MIAMLLRIGLRLLVCAAVTYLVWSKLGAVAFVLCAPLFGAALARPVIELFAEGFHVTKDAAFAPVQGRHYQYRGYSIDVLQQPDRFRWLSTTDVRQVIKALPRDENLRNLYPEDVSLLGAASPIRIKAERLHQMLEKSTHPDTVKFRLWLMRSVIMPGDRLRERLRRTPTP